MNENSHPIDFVIEFAWANGCDRFIINNAKDELKKLRKKESLSKEMSWEAFKANQFAVEQTNEYLKLAEEVEALKNKLSCYEK